MSRLMGEGGGRGRGSSSVPPPKTESAIAARRSFYCDLCSKGYSRQNEFEAHENSYDHQHKKRFLEMKAMQRDPGNAERRRERERRQDEKAGVITIKPIKIGGEEKTAGFKKGGFKSAFGGGGGGAGGKEGGGGDGGGGGGGFKKTFTGGGGEEVKIVKEEETEDAAGGEEEETEIEESDTEDEGWERYDPAKPTD